MASLTPSADKLFATESGEVGYTEGPNNFNKYAPIVGVANNEAWCTTFQSWAFKTSGFQSLCLMSNYSVDQYNWFHARGRANDYPAVGAVVWFGPGGGNHTGWVYSYDADYIYTIEGNFGNKVDFHQRLRRAVSDASIGEPFAYGYPDFAEGIITADPNQTVPGSRYQATGSVKVSPTTYTVVAGDNLEKVAAKLGVTVPVLVAANPQYLVVGSVLTVPGATPPPPPPPPPATSWVSSVAINNKTAISYGRYTAGGTVASWIGAACAARGITGTAAVAAWTKGYQTAIARESSGNANACNTNDSNNVTPAGFSQVADYGDGYGNPSGLLNGRFVNYQCSRGVAQCIPQTFASNHCPGTSGMIYDPVANIAASMGYVRAQYGVAVDGHDLASKVQQFDPNRPPKGY